MPRPRYRLRTLMIAVAAAGLACAVALAIKERRERFALIASRHTGVFPPIAYADLVMAAGPERVRLSLWSKRVLAWHAAMAKKYRQAASYPWLPVFPDPPQPPRPF